MPKSKKQKVEKFQFADPVMVTWRDCTGGSGWSSLHDEPIEPVVVHQLGFFLQRDKNTLHIAQGMPVEDCQILGLCALPVGCIVSLKKVKV